MKEKKDKNPDIDAVKKFLDCIEHPKDCKKGDKK